MLLPDTFANALVTEIKDVLSRCNLSLAMCRGQAYDGAANMQGVRNGVATQIQAEVPSAIPIHCLAHCLRLVLQQAGRKCKWKKSSKWPRCLKRDLRFSREI